LNTRRVGPYELEWLLGEGGIGQVYAARDTVLGRQVAIKTLRPELANDRQLMERFLLEAKSLGRLAHPNITTIYTLYTEGETVFMVMELVRGQTLEALLTRAHRFDLVDALAVVAQAAAGLGYAHQSGIIHRDIKPSNLMITDAGVLKIMDFGIARMQGAQGLTRMGDFQGTLSFASPEQIRGDPVDEHTDQYSLAVVFYKMLMGVAPFVADNDYALMTAHLQSPPPTLFGLVPGLNDETEASLMRALAKQPGDRFASVEDFAEAVGAAEIDSDAVEILRRRMVAIMRNDTGDETLVASRSGSSSGSARRRRGSLSGSRRSAAPEASAPSLRDPLPPRRRARWPSFAVAGVVAIIASAGGWYLFSATKPDVTPMVAATAPAAQAPAPPVAQNPPIAPTPSLPQPAEPAPPPPAAPATIPVPSATTSTISLPAEPAPHEPAPPSPSVSAASPTAAVPAAANQPTGPVTPSQPTAAEPMSSSPPVAHETPSSPAPAASAANSPMATGVEASAPAVAISPPVGSADPNTPNSPDGAALRPTGPPPAATSASPIGEAAWSLEERRGAQEALRTLGHLSGVADGDFGPQTRAAIVQFQSFADQPESGQLSDEERKQLLDMAGRLSSLVETPPTSPRGVAASSVRSGPERLNRAANVAANDRIEAAYWYRAAAADGEAKAFTNLGTLLVRGGGADKPDPADAKLLWLTAAARGEPIAMFNLGAMYERGIGVDSDPATARKWYERAAARGHTGARDALKRLKT
jgi:serine/threonine protein kinase